MNVRRKYLIFHDLEHRVDGIYSGSPRHISLLQPMYISDEYDELAAIVEHVARDTLPFTISAGKPDKFGTRSDVDVVRVIDDEGGLSSMHLRLMQSLGRRGLGCLIDERWSGIDYRPHSTVVENVPFPANPYTVGDISYYATDSEGRKIITRLPFGGRTGGREGWLRERFT